MRAVDEHDLVAGADSSVLLAKAGPASGRVLKDDDLSAMFGLDIVERDSPAEAEQQGPATRKTKSASARGATIVSAGPAHYEAINRRL